MDFIIILLISFILLFFCIILFMKLNYRKRFVRRIKSKEKPFIIGHRGVPVLEMENSLSSFKKLIDYNVDGTELDALITKDGIPVVYHDFHLKRLTNSQSNINSIVIKDFDNIYLKDFSGNKVRIPELEEVLNLLKDLRLINVEIKSESIKDKGVEKSVCNLLNKMGLKDNIIISSFNPFSLKRVAKYDDEFIRGLLVQPDGVPYYIKKFWFWEFAKPDLIHFSSKYLGNKIVDKFKDRGLEVVFWCIDNYVEYEKSLKHKPYAIISNIPHIVNNFN